MAEHEHEGTTAIAGGTRMALHEVRAQAARDGRGGGSSERIRVLGPPVRGEPMIVHDVLAVHEVPDAVATTVHAALATTRDALVQARRHMRRI